MYKPFRGLARLAAQIGRGARAMFRAAGMVFQGQGGFGNRWRFLLPGSQFDYEAAAGDLWQNNAVAACLRWIRTNFPEPVLEVVQEQANGSEKIIPGHEAVRRLKRPNPFYDWFTFSAAIVLSTAVDGNCYIRKIRAGSGQVVQLWWIPFWLVRPRWKPDGTEFIGWYEYQVNGKWIPVPVEDMIHIRIGIDPRNERLGWSELKSALRAICGLNECDTYTAAILRNMGIPGLVIGPGAPEVQLQDDDVEVLKGQFREDYTSEQRGEPLIATRMFKIEKITQTPEELRLDKLPARLEDQVHAVLGVPAMVTGVASGASHKTYANYGEARKAAYEDCLIPLQKCIAEALTHQYLVDFVDVDAGYRLRFNYTGVQGLQESATDLADRLGKLYQTYQVITRAEAREGLGFDFDAEDDVFYQDTKPAPVMMPPGSSGTPGKAKEQLPQDGEAGDDVEDDDEENEKPKKKSRTWARIESILTRIDEQLSIRRKPLRGPGDGGPGPDRAAA